VTAAKRAAGGKPAKPPVERRLSTILVADVYGYSRMMGENEERTVRVFRGHREVFESLVAQHRGRIFNTAGDALLAEFSSAVEAVRCATDIQSTLRTRNDHLPPEERLQFRIGINLGDVILQGGDLLGDGVNVAARIQAATEPGGICISGSVYEQIQNKLSLDFKLLGELAYKNIAKPVRTYTINEGGAVTTTLRKRSVGKIGAAVAGLVLAGAAAYWASGELAAQRAERARAEAELAAQKQATAAALAAAETAKREAKAQAEKQAAEEALRRAQEERTRLAQDLKALEAEKRAAEARKPAAAAVPSPALLDGLYEGRLCNEGKKRECWPVALAVRDGIAEGNWLSRTKGTASARGTVGADGGVRLNLAAWTPRGEPTVATMVGRTADGAISASGKWREGGTVVGEWRRATAGAAATRIPLPARSAARFDGAYEGRVCNEFRERPPRCWPVKLVAREGRVEGQWPSSTGNTSRIGGTIDAQGAVDVKLAAWTAKGAAIEGNATGRASEGAMEIAGRWADRGIFTGTWKRIADARR